MKNLRKKCKRAALHRKQCRHCRCQVAWDGEFGCLLDNRNFFLQHLRIVFFFLVVVVVVVVVVVAVAVVVVVVVVCCVLTYLGNFPIFFFSCHFQI